MTDLPEATRKVRRGVIAERYSDIIAALDEGAPEVKIHSTVRCQNGSRADRPITLAVHRPLDPDALAGRRRRPVWSGRA